MSSSSAIALSDQENTHSGSLPVAETSLKSDYLQENTHSGSLRVAETSLKNDYLQEFSENTHCGSLPVAETSLKSDCLQENTHSGSFWKQPLAEMQGKACLHYTLGVGPFPGPPLAGTLCAPGCPFFFFTHSGSLPVAETPLKNDHLQENTHGVSLLVAETSLKNDYLQENSGSGSFALAESSLKLENDLERREAEEKHRKQIIARMVESAKAIMTNRDLEDKKNSSQKERKKAWTVTRPIHILDTWNTGKILGKPLLASGRRRPNKTPKFVDLDVEKLRKLRPDHIPVTVEKDARSDIRDTDNKKYHVHGETPLGEFVTFIRLEIRSKKRIFVFFKNTKPSMSSLMSAIYEENKGEDGFLHITYSGEKNSMIENSRGGSLDLAESSFKQENHPVEQNSPDPIPEKVQAEENSPDPIPEKVQAEENNPDPTQMTVEKAAGMSLLSQVTMRKQKRLAGSPLYQVFAKKSLPEQRRKIDDFPKNRIGCLDPWNYIKFKKAMSSSPGMSKSVRKFYLKVYQKHYGKEIQRTCPDAKQLREKHPDHIPVSLEKDAWSDSGIPDIDMNKYHVHGHMTVDQFVGWIRRGLEVGKDFPVRVFCKNTELTADALMSSIDEKNEDDDGFLRLTYSGVERAM